MILIMKTGVALREAHQLAERLAWMGLRAHVRQQDGRIMLGVVQGAEAGVHAGAFAELPGVEAVHAFSQPFKLTGRELNKQRQVIRVGPAAIGGDELMVMAGPCAVESEEQIFATAALVADAGATVLRGGAFKPRTSPYDFQGLGEPGLKLLAAAGKAHGLPVVSEVMDAADAEMVACHVDIVQVGARNMQNFSLLKQLSKIGKPVMLKRGLSATYKEFLLAAEYLLNGGNQQVILCERGIRTYETHTRNTLDLAAIPVLKGLSHLPVLADPSHGTGLRSLVAPMARAAVAAGADGLMIEVHPNPEQALSDGPQSLYPGQFSELMRELSAIAGVVGKTIAVPCTILENAG